MAAMVNPRATDEDLTAKARIRNAALDLYAEHGEERVSLRAVAAAAGVTLGLVQHHFKTKAGLREAVDQLVVDHFAHALAGVPPQPGARETAATRDEAVRRMLQENPPVVNYLRRAMLEAGGAHVGLLDAIIDLTAREVSALRAAGLASTERREPTQVVAVLVRQVGELLLEPMVEATWARVAPGDTTRPRLSIEVED